MKIPIAAQKVVPHRGSMLLIDTLTVADGQNGRAVTTLTDQCIAVDSALVTPLLGVELMAQAFAAVKGWEALQAGVDLPNGYLVGVRKYNLTKPIPANEELVIDVATAGEFEGFAVVTGEITCNGEQLATGKIKLWVPEDEA